MRRLLGDILAIMAAMMSAACVEDIAQIPDAGSASAEKVQMTFSAVSDADTKLTLVDKTQVWWNPRDAIMVNGDVFYSTLKEPSPYSEFIGETTPTDEYCAVASNVGVEYVDGVYSFSLSTYQFARKNNLPIFFSAAKNEDSNQCLHFNSMLGYIKFTIPEGGLPLSQVAVKTMGDEIIASRNVTVDFSGDEPELMLLDDEFSWSFISLNSTTDNMESGDYYMALYPGTYSKGLEFTFNFKDGKGIVKRISQELSLESGTIKNIGVISDSWLNEQENQLALEREALIEFYNATGGDNWKNNDNWCSDEPIEDWYGISTDQQGSVWELYLADNNLTGSIPESIGNFKGLTFLTLRDNNLTGSIPESIGNMKVLREFNVQNTNLIGSIPESIGNLTELESLIIRDTELTGSIPESIGNMRNLETLFLDNNQLTGELPASIGNLTKLRRFSAINNNFSGSIPESICNLINLEGLWLQNNQLTGELPPEIGNLTKLKEVQLSRNMISGILPESINKLINLESFSIRYNYLTGTVPKGLMEMENWPTEWPEVLDQEGEGMSGEGLVIPAPKFEDYTIDGEALDYSIYSENEYTVLYHYFEICPYFVDFTVVLVELYNGYKNKGLEVISFSSMGTVESHRRISENFNTKWPYITLSNSMKLFKAHLLQSPCVCVVDKDGYIIFNQYTDDYNDLDEFLLDRLGQSDPTEPSDVPKLYESTDYSKDGEVKLLQAATKGKGIDIVLMGDAYSDRLIADGTYDRTMNISMEKFFEEEPYKSFRDYFNVYSVTVVSKNDVYSSISETALGGFFGNGTEVGGDHTSVFSYALKAINEERMDQAVIVVMMNSIAYAGTCYMNDPEEGGDWGNGTSVSYFPTGSDDESLGQVLHHEACGHGFAKLADEYFYIDSGHIPDEEIQYYKAMEQYGWWKNADFTSDPTQVKWSHFLEDSRYANDGLGVYEGAFTYWTGAYRPTEDSIMSSNTGGFNAPSREAIYYRIHKLAYGPDWEYDYEKFVEYDAINRKSAPEGAGMQKRRANYVDKPFEPTAPPVIIKGSWRDVVR